MSHLPYSTVIRGLTGPLPVLFGEADEEQLLACHKLVGLEFGNPLSSADFIERENFMNGLAAARGGHSWWRVWCVYSVEEPTFVMASCKTIRRELLVEESSPESAYETVGYCISAVVVHSEYRGIGLGSFLLASVKQWLDTDGNATLSMLYSNKERFYLKNGWRPMFAPEITLIVHSPSSSADTDDPKFPQSEKLKEQNVKRLCERDIEVLRAEIHQREAGEPHTSITVLPTADLVSWLHGRAEILGLKIGGRSPQNKGAICGEDTWMFWHHDFRKQCLYIQRVRSLEQDHQRRISLLAALFLSAYREAEAWELLSVVTWDTSPQIAAALDLLKSETAGIEIVVTEKRRETLSVRGKNDSEPHNLDIFLNEPFAWN